MSTVWKRGRRGAGRGKRGREKKKIGGRQAHLFKRNIANMHRGMLLVVVAESVSCQDPKGRAVKMPEF